jgi:ribosomal protein S18 acetylase RimI-like enzyme
MPIRPAEVSDARELAEVHIASWQTAYRGLYPDTVLDGFSVESGEKRWKERLPHESTKTLVYELDGRVVGFVRFGASRGDAAEEGVGEISAIYLTPFAWGKGYGRALLEAALESLRAAGYDEATLWVLKDNPRAIRFYEAAGFQADGTVKTVPRHGVELEELRYRRSL